MSKIQTFCQVWTKFGYLNGSILVAFSLLHALFRFQRLEIVVLTPDSLNRSFLDLDRRYQACFVEEEDLFRHSRAEKSLELGDEFLSAALAKNDKCYAIFDGETLANYGWYSNEPTLISDELLLSFDPRYVYMYKGFTDFKYRGQRLHAIGMSRALLAYAAKSSRGIVSYVDRTNFASLKSVARMGYQRSGSVYILKVWGRYFISSTPGCREYAIKVEPKGAPPA